MSARASAHAIRSGRDDGRDDSATTPTCTAFEGSDREARCGSKRRTVARGGNRRVRLRATAVNSRRTAATRCLLRSRDAARAEGRSRPGQAGIGCADHRRHRGRSRSTSRSTPPHWGLTVTIRCRGPQSYPWACSGHSISSTRRGDEVGPRPARAGHRGRRWPGDCWCSRGGSGLRAVLPRHRCTDRGHAGGRPPRPPCGRTLDIDHWTFCCWSSSSSRRSACCAMRCMGAARGHASRLPCLPPALEGRPPTLVRALRPARAALRPPAGCASSGRPPSNR